MPDTPEQVGWPLNTGVAADAARAASPSDLSPASGSSHSGIANAEVLGIKLESATPSQLGDMAKTLSSLIGLYSESVASAQERYERDCAFLANIMAELTKVTHYITRVGANVLEAQGIEAATAGETQSGSTVGESPVPAGDAPETSRGDPS